MIEQLRTPWPRPEMIELIYFITRRFVKSDGKSFFLTSDNPVHFFESVGLSSPVGELSSRSQSI